MKRHDGERYSLRRLVAVGSSLVDGDVEVGRVLTLAHEQPVGVCALSQHCRRNRAQ